MSAETLLRPVPSEPPFLTERIEADELNRQQQRYAAGALAMIRTVEFEA